MLKMLLLERSVKSCDACYNGAEALSAVLRSQPPRPLAHYDLVFMDSNMPKMVSFYYLIP